MEVDFRAHILADAAVAALVVTRVHPDKIPQNSQFPAIRYQRIFTDQVHSHQGATGLAFASMQVDCYAATAAVVNDLAEKVRLALAGFSGTVGATVFRVMLLEDDSSEIEPDGELYRRIQEYLVGYQTAIS